jgi:hypothetical protein
LVDEFLKPYLSTRELIPENQEMPFHVLNLANIPEALLFRRNHFAYPLLKEELFQLHIFGEVAQPRTFDLQAIRSMPSRTIPVVLECAGNKRSFVTTLNVNSSIQRPLDRSILRKGKHNIRGIAWTGMGENKRVQLSFDKGDNWDNAQLNKFPGQSQSWLHWHYDWEPRHSGEYSIMSRSEDAYGRVQPMVARWNRKGYGYNAVDRVTICVD